MLISTTKTTWISPCICIYVIIATGDIDCVVIITGNESICTAAYCNLVITVLMLFTPFEALIMSLLFPVVSVLLPPLIVIWSFPASMLFVPPLILSWSLLAPELTVFVPPDKVI